MKSTKALVLAPVVLLAACGGGDEQTLHTKTTPGSVIYSYPMTDRSTSARKPT
ncbi:hypothetical protein [uncultured Marinobacter sp.]|jgi:hypothetical protein|uniref:hypothetical protein n=1 Tax=uncultured Marinobacter sp. TaxID=187379 RepID=UPI0032B234B6|tara:strand:- start:6959 stop:7117 length:159 start_codon:yes stop_codon:yes gene_type:complete